MSSANFNNLNDVFPNKRRCYERPIADIHVNELVQHVYHHYHVVHHHVYHHHHDTYNEGSQPQMQPQPQVPAPQSAAYYHQPQGQQQEQPTPYLPSPPHTALSPPVIIAPRTPSFIARYATQSHPTPPAALPGATSRKNPPTAPHWLPPPAPVPAPAVPAASTPPIPTFCATRRAQSLTTPPPLLPPPLLPPIRARSLETPPPPPPQLPPIRALIGEVGDVGYSHGDDDGLSTQQSRSTSPGLTEYEDDRSSLQSRSTSPGLTEDDDDDKGRSDVASLGEEDRNSFSRTFEGWERGH